jgi:uncharacterized UPF0160 family protein
MAKYVKAVYGGREELIPMEDYLDIVAMQSGYDSYKEMQEEGLSITVDAESIVEPMEYSVLLIPEPRQSNKGVPIPDVARRNMLPVIEKYMDGQYRVDAAISLVPKEWGCPAGGEYGVAVSGTTFDRDELEKQVSGIMRELDLSSGEISYKTDDKARFQTQLNADVYTAGLLLQDAMEAQPDGPETVTGVLRIEGGKVFFEGERDIIFQQNMETYRAAILDELKASGLEVIGRPRIQEPAQLVERTMDEPGKECNGPLDQVQEVVVHNGAQHLDDLLVAAMMKKLNPDIKITRTRDADYIENAKRDPGVLVADVGLGEFDHHEGSAERTREDGRKYAACGLVYEKARELLFHGDPVKQENFESIVIIPAEHEDNGQVLEGEPQPLLSRYVQALMPEWNSTETPDDSFARITDQLVDVVTYASAHNGHINEAELYNEIHRLEREKAAVHEEGVQKVKDIYGRSENKEVIVLDDPRYPWVDALWDTDAKFAVFPTSNNEIAIQAVPPEATVPGCFEQKIPIPSDALAMLAEEGGAQPKVVGTFIGFAPIREGYTKEEVTEWVETIAKDLVAEDRAKSDPVFVKAYEIADKLGIDHSDLKFVVGEDQVLLYDESLDMANILIAKMDENGQRAWVIDEEKYADTRESVTIAQETKEEVAKTVGIER